MAASRSFANQDVEDYLIANGQAEGFLDALASVDRHTIAKLLNKATQDETGQTGVELADLCIKDPAFAADLARRVAALGADE